MEEREKVERKICVTAPVHMKEGGECVWWVYRRKRHKENL